MATKKIISINFLISNLVVLLLTTPAQSIEKISALPIKSDSRLQTNSCNTELLNYFSSDCQSYSMLIRETSFKKQSGFIDQVQCHFRNNISIISYQIDTNMYIDVTGFSGNHIIEQPTEKDHTLHLNNCEEHIHHLKYLQSLTERPFPVTSPKEFKENHNVTLVASQKTCELLSSDLKKLKSIYEFESRLNSTLICIPQRIVDQKNPSLIKQHIPINSNFIFIIGSNIPTFETHFKLDTDRYFYGTTDLPYGMSDGFWNKPIHKSDPRLFDIVYKQKDYVYKTDTPTLFSYDLGQLSKNLIDSSMLRLKTPVTRWIEFGTDSEKIKNQFHHFVSIRSAYKPTRTQNIIRAQGNTSILYETGSFFNSNDIETELLELKKSSNINYNTITLGSTNLRALVNNSTPKNTTILSLSEHGNSMAIGNLFMHTVSDSIFFPPVLDLDACQTGMWGFHTERNDSLVGKIFNSNHPPLALIASQTIKAMRTFGKSDLTVDNTFLSGWRSGQSLGARTLEIYNHYLDALRANEIKTYKQSGLPFHLTQFLSVFSTFGDPTFEL